MSPDADRVLRRRHSAIIGLRLASLALACFGVVTVGRHLVPLTERYQPFDFWPYGASVVCGLAVFGLPAAALAASSGWLARWIVPPPLSGCPACGYPVKGVAGGKCPECGTPIGRPS